MKTYTIEQVNELLDIERRATAAAQEHADKASRWEAEANRLSERVDELENALREAMEWNWLDEDSPPPAEVVEQCREALGTDGTRTTKMEKALRDLLDIPKGMGWFPGERYKWQQAAKAIGEKFSL